jgi:hypothetical protein
MLISFVQTLGFLNAMAKNVDLANIEAPMFVDEPHGGFKTPFVFEAMRRPLHLVGQGV